MLEYSDRAKNGYAFLYRHYNDIDIYVEDTSCLAMWENLLRVIINGRCRLNRVFQLGGKTKVIEACRHDQGASPRRRLYIIDGDFDIWRGRRKPRLKHLYRLNTYCVENLVLAESGVVEVLRDGNPTEKGTTIRSRLDYQGFLADCEKLFGLFSSYAAVFALGISVQTTSYSVYRLLDTSETPHRPSESAIRCRTIEVHAEAERLVSREKLGNIQVKVGSNIRKGKITAIRHISGKHYLFPLLYIRCRSLAGYSEAAEVLKARLARHYVPSYEPGLRRAVEALLV